MAEKATATGFKYFHDEFMALQGIKRALMEKAIEGGVNKSQTCQLVFSRCDAKLEEAILYVQHADMTMAFFDKLAEQAADKAAGGAEGSNIVEFKPKD